MRMIIIFACAIIAALPSWSFALTIHGWSSDSSKYAFSESIATQAQVTNCLYVIDSVKNTFDRQLCGAKNDDKRTNTLVKTAVEQKRYLDSSRISNPGRVVYSSKLVSLGEMDTFTQFGAKLVKFNNNGREYTMELTDSHKGEGNFSHKSGFEISLSSGNQNKILQKDKLLRRNHIAYRIVNASISPDGKKIGIIVEAISSEFENDKVPHYKGITGLID